MALPTLCPKCRTEVRTDHDLCETCRAHRPEVPTALPLAKPVARARRPVPPVLRPASTAAAPARPKSGPDQRGSKKPSKRKWLIACAVGAVALGIVAVAVIGITRLGNAVEREQEAGGPSEAVAKARPAVPPPASGVQLIEMPIPVIDPAAWRVRADPIPPATDLLGAVPIGETFHTKRFSFSDPAAGKVLLAASTELQWIDLRGGAKHIIPRKTTPDSRPPRHAVISPSGDRFSTIGVEMHMLRESHSLGVYNCRDGTPVGVMTVDLKSNDPFEALYFLDENRVLHYHTGRLRVFDIERRKIVFETSVPFKATPQLTPGRRWIYGRTAGGYSFFDTEAGKPAGSIQLNGPWRNSSGSDFNVDSRLAVDGDGRRALLVAPIHTSVQLVSIDLDKGGVTGSSRCEDAALSSGLGMRASWASDKLVAFESGFVLDLPAKSLAMTHALGDRIPLTYSGYLPDRRAWFVESNKRLVSAAMPDAADIAASDGYGLYPWPVGTPLRVEAGGPGDVAHHTELVELAAKALAKRGFPIDPNAKARLLITTGPITKGSVYPDATAAEIKSATRWNPSLRNTDGDKTYYKVEKGLLGSLVVETFGSDGKKLPLTLQCRAEVVGYNAQRLLAIFAGELESQLDSGELEKPRDDPANPARRLGRDIPIKIGG